MRIARIHTLKQPLPLPPPPPPLPLEAELAPVDHVLLELELQSSDGLLEFAAGLLLLPQSSNVDLDAPAPPLLLLELDQSSVLAPQSLLDVDLAAVWLEPVAQGSGVSQSVVPVGAVDLGAVVDSEPIEAQSSAAELLTAATTGALASAPQSSVEAAAVLED